MCETLESIPTAAMKKEETGGEERGEGEVWGGLCLVASICPLASRGERTTPGNMSVV